MPIRIKLPEEPDWEAEYKELSRRYREKPPTRAERRKWGNDTRVRYHEFVVHRMRYDRLIKEGFSDYEAMFYMRRKIGGFKVHRMRKERAKYCKTLSASEKSTLLRQLNFYFRKRTYEKKGEIGKKVYSPYYKELEDVVELWELAMEGRLVEGR